MSQTVEKKEHNMAVITVEVPAEEFEKAVEKAYQRNKKSISVPGFRKGKVPRQLIEKMYGKEVFFEDAANICVPDAWEKAYDECEEEIVSSPKIDIKQIDKEREEQSRMIAVDREAKNGDQAIIDFEGFIDDVAFEGGKGENHALTLGSGSFIPGFEEQVEGHKAGDEFDVNVTFPEDYHAEQLKGKPAVFKCRLHEVKEKEVPALDEDFADDAGFDSVDAYKADVKKKLEERKAAEAKDKKETAVLDKLIEDAKMDIPDAMVETGARRSLDQFNQQLMMQGMSIQQYYQYTGLNEQAMIEAIGLVKTGEITYAVRDTNIDDHDIRKGDYMNEKIYYTAGEIAEMLGVSTGKSYKILQQMNEELEKKGYLTIRGKIPVEYFKEKWYGALKE